MHSFGKIVSILLILTALFLLPVSYAAQKQDFLTQIYIQETVEKFVDQVRSKGYLTEEMYLYFMNELDAGGNLYHIKMKHMRVIFDPEDAFQYELCTYEKEILEKIHKKGEGYTMFLGDYFNISVCSRTETMTEQIRRAADGIYASAGGRIRDEVWRKEGMRQ